jgi:hypothetical protein
MLATSFDLVYFYFDGSKSCCIKESEFAILRVYSIIIKSGGRVIPEGSHRRQQPFGDNKSKLSPPVSSLVNTIMHQADDRCGTYTNKSVMEDEKNAI